MNRKCVGIGALRIQESFKRNPFLTVLVICSDYRVVTCVLCHVVDEPVRTVIDTSCVFACMRMCFSGDLMEKVRERKLIR